MWNAAGKPEGLVGTLLMKVTCSVLAQLLVPQPSWAQCKWQKRELINTVTCYSLPTCFGLCWAGCCRASRGLGPVSQAPSGVLVLIALLHPVCPSRVCPQWLLGAAAEPS